MGFSMGFNLRTGFNLADNNRFRSYTENNVFAKFLTLIYTYTHCLLVYKTFNVMLIKRAVTSARVAIRDNCAAFYSSCAYVQLLYFVSNKTASIPK